MYAFILAVFVEFCYNVAFIITLALFTILSVFRLFSVLVACVVLATFPANPLINLSTEPYTPIISEVWKFVNPFFSDFLEFVNRALPFTYQAGFYRPLDLPLLYQIFGSLSSLFF